MRLTKVSLLRELGGVSGRPGSVAGSSVGEGGSVDFFLVGCVKLLKRRSFLTSVRLAGSQVDIK